MKKSTFHISKMDCPSEENLIRVKLQRYTDIKGLDFDLDKRELHVYQEQLNPEIEKVLQSLQLGSQHVKTEAVSHAPEEEQGLQRKLLWTVLFINFLFFVIEMIFGWISGSMGLIADSLDMLADSFVYGISLLAVGAAVSRQKKVAGIAGIFQLTLAILGFFEVVRRFIEMDESPDYQLMITVSIFALLANALCLYLLQKSKSQAAHMKASMIFTSNDIIINCGVILAGLLVLWLDSSLPDLIIGAIVFGLVLQGAIRILKLSK